MPRMRWESNTLSPGLTAFPNRLKDALFDVMKFHEPRVASYMRDNAPWTDRTGNARGGLAAKAYRVGDNFGIVAFGQMPYQIWLEIANNGRYRIIQPTILNQGAAVMRTVSKLMRRMEK